MTKAEQFSRHPEYRQGSASPRCGADDASCGTPGAEPTAQKSAEAAEDEPTDSEVLKHLLRQFQELRESVSHYAAAKTDSVKCSARNAIRRFVLTALGFVAVCGLIVMASWLVLSGIAQGLGKLFAGQSWIGALLTGLAVLGAAGVTVWRLHAASREKSRLRILKKYELRKANQRTRFDRDVSGRAPAAIAQGE